MTADPHPLPNRFPGEIRLVPLGSIPEVEPGADIARLIVDAAAQQQVALEDGCVVVVAQKIISKAENRIVDLAAVVPSERAASFAAEFGKDPRLIELALRESRRIVRMERGVLIVETRHGLICANGGVDASNVAGPDRATLLPEDPDRSAAALRERLKLLAGRGCAVIITDTFGRPWRDGLANVAIGAAGFRTIEDLRGQYDRQGRELHATVIAVADELAAAAGLLMKKTAGVPVVLIFGAELTCGDGHAADLIRPPERDLFR